MQNISWNRILVEGTAIVASILLAFSIDAWWEQRVDDAEARVLVEGMRADFSTSQAELDERIRVVNNIYEANRDFLRRVQSAEIGEELEIPYRVLVGVLGAPTYSPTDSTLQTAMASGDIELVDDPELTNAIALWRQQLADTSEDEILTRNLVVRQLVPELSKQVRLGNAFEYEPLMSLAFSDAGSISGEPVTLMATSELEGLLAQRLFYFRFVVDGLAGIRETQGRILELIDNY
jgi:hypothetical protein